MSGLRGNSWLRLVGLSVLAVALICATLSIAAPAVEKTSKDDPRLQKWLKRFPEADADKDGVLTVTEARAYRGKQKAGKAAGAQARKALTPTLKDQRYGPHKRNVLDFYKVDSDEPTAVMIYFHGGGFVGGDKVKAAQADLPRQCLKAGISVIGANYRLVKGRGDEPGAPFPAPMLDGARAVQFVRSKAEEWNIDPERVALAGGSAGACMSIWIALHDDLAKPDSEDPVERLSTRVCCVVSQAGQTTLDPKFVLEQIGGASSVHPSLLPFYGIKSLDELGKPEVQKLVREASAVNYATKDDPAIYLDYGGVLDNTPLPENTSVNISIHHPKFGELLKQKLDELGVECHFYYEGKPTPPSGKIDFVKKHLRVQ